MKTDLIRIGNSRGIRIPKPIIEQCGLGDTVELRVVDDRLVVSAPRAPRHGWDEVFQKAGPSFEDEPLLGTTTANTFDHEDWKW
jgi:antitoxin MazE